jgi:hypothetical protein
LLGQKLVSALIVLAAFVGLMMLAIDLNDPLPCRATEIDGGGWNRVFTTKLLVATATISQHLPDVLRKLVRSGSLSASNRYRLWIAPRLPVHAAPPIRNSR